MKDRGCHGYKLLFNHLSSMFCCTSTKILLMFVFSWLTRMQVVFSRMINTEIRKHMDRRGTYFFVLFLMFFFFSISTGLAMLLYSKGSG